MEGLKPADASAHGTGGAASRASPQETATAPEKWSGGRGGWGEGGDKAYGWQAGQGVGGA